MNEITLQIQPLRSLDEMPPVVALQQTYWGDQPGATIASHMLFSVASHGGHVLAATDGDAIAGVVIGLLGMNMEHSDRPAAENLHIYSKRMVVSRDYRNRGLGSRLKFAQRDFALRHGIDRVVWTYDPLLAPNAHLNLRKLGGISRDYRENYYGTNNTGGLSPDGTSDRLYLEWHLNEPGVKARAENTHRPPTFAELIDLEAKIINLADHTSGEFPVPGGYELNRQAKTVLVEIPRQYQKMMRDAPELARAWREHSRATLGEQMQLGYRSVDFVSGEVDGAIRGFYVLSLV